jgi:flagellar basal body-associated protein FliL
MVKQSKIQLILTVLPVLSAGLYLVGSIYRESYLLEFGVDDSLFGLSIDRILLHGFSSFMSFSLLPFVYGILIALLLIAVTVLAASLAFLPVVHRIHAAAQKRIVSARNWIGRKLKRGAQQPAPTMMKLVDRSEVLYGYILLLLGIVLLLVGAVVLSSDAGKKQSQKDMKLWAEGKHRSAMVTIDDEVAIAAFHITCGSSHCAFWTGNEARIVRHDQIKRFTVKPAVVGRGAK